MKKALTLTAALSTAMVLAGATAGVAQASGDWKPLNTTAKLSGELRLEQSIVIFCDVHIDVVVDGHGNISVTNRTFSGADPLCGTLVNPFGTWDIEDNPGFAPASSGPVDADVGSSSILGQCFGTITGTWDNNTHTLSFSNAQVPGTPSPCFVSGTLTSNQPLTAH